MSSAGSIGARSISPAFVDRRYFEHIIKARFGLGGLDAAAVGEANGYVRTYGSGLNAHLHDRKYLVDDILTVADFAVVATLPYAEKAFAAIERWDARLNALPAWRDPFPAAKKPA